MNKKKKRLIKEYLPDGAKVYSSGCHLRYNLKTNEFEFIAPDESTYYDGNLVSFDENGAYIEVYK